MKTLEIVIIRQFREPHFVICLTRQCVTRQCIQVSEIAFRLGQLDISSTDYERTSTDDPPGGRRSQVYPRHRESAARSHLRWRVSELNLLPMFNRS